MKTLIATLIAAAALAGSQASAYDYDHVFTLSQMPDGESIFEDGHVLVNIDAQRTLEYLYADRADILTLDFQGSYVLTASEDIDTPDFSRILNITSTVDAVKTAWKTAFSGEGGSSITLCSARNSLDNNYGTLQFFGAAVNETVSLDGTDVTFKGVVSSLNYLNDNEVGIVWGSTTASLVGKIAAEPGPTPPVPEPTTGSLSLLALAGLCARRRRK